MRSPLTVLATLALAAGASANPPEPTVPPDPLDSAIPNEALIQPFKDQIPIKFVTRASDPATWAKLGKFWNETIEEAIDPITGEKVTRTAVAIKVPLGLNTAPDVPTDNPMTLAKWELGKKLYYDRILSTDNSIACANCHWPNTGFTDQNKTSLGINANLGGMNAPTVINSAYNRFLFWDGRAVSLEDQAQGPVGNPLEMFAGKDEPWEEAILRLREQPEYVKAFREVFGHLPTRDAAAKAIASYERTVLSGNSIHDRADLAMRKRVAEEESNRFEPLAEDYKAVMKQAFDDKDLHSLKALGLDPAKDADRVSDVGAKIALGRELFFGKARCSNCHVGDNFSDNDFHNLGVGVEDGKVPGYDFGRYNILPTGAKDPAMIGAFKTPGLRALTKTHPYMHDGSEKTLEAVIELYDRGGNPNEFLDAKMRDIDAELAFLRAKATGKPYSGPEPTLFTRNGRPIIPFRLNLTPDEKAALVLFMRALEGDPIDPIVADPRIFPSSEKSASR